MELGDEEEGLLIKAEDPPPPALVPPPTPHPLNPNNTSCVACFTAKVSGPWTWTRNPGSCVV